MSFVIAAGAACAPPSRSAPQAITSDTLAIETLSIRHMLSEHSNWPLQVDTLYAEPNQAPAGLTSIARPRARHAALLAAISAATPASAADTLNVRASRPEIVHDTARVYVTIGYPRRGSRRGFYETVALTLRRTGSTWILSQRVQLGIS